METFVEWGYNSQNLPEQLNKINVKGKTCQQIRSLESKEKLVTETPLKGAQSKAVISAR